MVQVRELDPAKSTAIEDWAQAIEIARENGDINIISFTILGIIINNISSMLPEDLAKVLKFVDELQGGDWDNEELFKPALEGLI